MEYLFILFFLDLPEFCQTQSSISPRSLLVQRVYVLRDSLRQPRSEAHESQVLLLASPMCMPDDTLGRRTCMNFSCEMLLFHDTMIFLGFRTFLISQTVTGRQRVRKYSFNMYRLTCIRTRLLSMIQGSPSQLRATFLPPEMTAKPFAESSFGAYKARLGFGKALRHGSYVFVFLTILRNYFAGTIRRKGECVWCGWETQCFNICAVSTQVTLFIMRRLIMIILKAVPCSFVVQLAADNAEPYCIDLTDSYADATVLSMTDTDLTSFGGFSFGYGRHDMHHVYQLRPMHAISVL